MIWIGFDTETYPMSQGDMAPKIVCASYARHAPDGVRTRLEARDETRERLAGLLADPAVRLTAHNAAFDAKVVCATWPELTPAVLGAYAAGRFRCTLIDQTLVDLADFSLRPNVSGAPKGRSLQSLVAWYFDVYLPKDGWRLRYHELDGLPAEAYPDEARRYAEDDAFWALQVRDAIEKRAAAVSARRGVDVLADAPRQAEAHFVLELMSAEGVRVDPVGLEAVRARAHERQCELRHQLLTAQLLTECKNGTYRRKAKRAAELAELEASKNPKHPRTEKGEPSLKAKHAKLYESPALRAYIEYSRWDSVVALLDTLAKGTRKPLHPGYQPIKATGRMSSGGKAIIDDPASRLNIQNPRRAPGYREVYVPTREGWAFVFADLPAIESRTLAQTCLDLFGYSKMAETLNAGYDTHTFLAAVATGREYAELQAKVEAEDDEALALRQGAKAINFSFPAALGERKLNEMILDQYKIRLSPSRWAPRPLAEDWRRVEWEHMPKSVFADAVPGWDGEAFDAPDGTRRVATYELRDAWSEIWVCPNSYGWWRSVWFSAYPEMPRFYQHVEHLPQEEIWLKGAKGKGRYPVKLRVVTTPRAPRVRAGATLCAAANQHFQGPASDIIKTAMILYNREALTDPISPLYGTKLWLVVHDELGTSCPADRVHEVGERLSAIMEQAVSVYCPDVPAKVKALAMWRWAKKAKRVVVDGRLVPDPATKVHPAVGG